MARETAVDAFSCLFLSSSRLLALNESCANDDYKNDQTPTLKLIQVPPQSLKRASSYLLSA